VAAPCRSQDGGGDLTPAAAAPATNQVARSPWGNGAESPGRRRGGGVAVELLRLLINFDRLTVLTNTG